MQVMMSMQEIFYQNCEIYGALVMGSDLKLGQIDHIVQIFQIYIIFIITPVYI